MLARFSPGVSPLPHTHLVGAFEGAVDEVLDDGCLPHPLITEKNNLVLLKGRVVPQRGRAGGHPAMSVRSWRFARCRHAVPAPGD